MFGGSVLKIMRRSDEYERDSLEEIRENYDIIDKNIGLQKFEDSIHENMEEVNNLLWMDEVNELLQNMGLDYTIDFEKIPADRLKRIKTYYEKNSWTSDDYGNVVERDPFSDFYSSGKDPKEELYNLGYMLGQKNDLGIYYLLLPDINFSRGYWNGKFISAVEKNDDNMILEVSNEMKVYNPETAEEELSKIVNTVFSADNYDNLNDKNKGKRL